MESIRVFTITTSSPEPSVITSCFSAISASLALKANLQDVSKGALQFIPVRPNVYQINYTQSRSDIPFDTIQLWAQQTIQTSMIRAAAGLGWQAASVTPCRPRVESVLALVHTRRLLRRAVTSLTSGVRVQFVLPSGVDAFVLHLGGPFSIPTRLRRGEVFGQVTRVIRASGYDALSICDSSDGPRQIVLPAHMLSKPSVGDCIYAGLRPIRGSRLAWQLHRWQLVQPDLFPEELQSMAREQNGYECTVIL